MSLFFMVQNHKHIGYRSFSPSGFSVGGKQIIKVYN